MLLVQAGALKNRFSFNTEIYDDFFFYFDKLEISLLITHAHCRSLNLILSN